MDSVDNLKFSFRFVSINENEDGVNNYNPEEISQATDIPVKIPEGNKSSYDCHNFNNATSCCSFPTALKYPDVRCLKRTINLIKKIIDQLTSTQM